MDLESLSDHKYVSVQMDFDVPNINDFHFKTTYNKPKFVKNFQKLLPDLYSKLENVKDRVSLDLFFKFFVDSVSECAYKSYRNKTKVTDNLYNAKDLVSLVWVKAHAGNPGNELGDHFAKIASSCGADMSIPAPYSYVKRVCKEFLMNEWNSYWKNSTTGKRIKEIPPSANLDLLISNKYVIYLLTNHGPFPAYLYRFKILNNPDCLFDHYLTSCMYTKDYHLLLPTGLLGLTGLENFVKTIYF
ncbi:hypothetical protein AVEN_236878-1 [Araneus ventricosus]|uniref:Uncharacterized protein n=1 Tax=Araneus ventricosus TaxID=182803 RepID=A0A4Y2RBP7_ARAVE|nr:hypothetical protein AVEN_5784-1 [Araneus ventricosus]GBN73190.1 hypothetical protein AVEN_236878-1 [Araneus ventricosus]